MAAWTVLIGRAEIDGKSRADVRLAGGCIAEIAPSLEARPGEPRLDAAGGALLPGLHDHHLHLLALAAAETSLRCGPPEVRTRDALAAALRARSPHAGWIRGIGYCESVAGGLDRAALDALRGDCPIRIQHRSGALWMLNSAALARVGIDAGADAPGVERDADGRATGRLYRLDGWLRERLSGGPPPDLWAVGRRLAACGVTGVTDATPGNAAAELALLVGAVDAGALPQRLLVMGAPSLPDPAHPHVERGAVKVLLSEHDLPGLECLASRIREAHVDGRPVAIHCVTRSELVLATGALTLAGGAEGDRIEHAAVAPPDVLALLAVQPVTVVSQPNFVRERGDAYLAEVEPRDRPWLYRCRGFLDARVPLGAGTDAPFGDPDPWLAMQAAIDRRTADGERLGGAEGLSPERALALFTSSPGAPGGPPRRVAVGAPADLCLLDRPWARAREELSSACVAATLRNGCQIWGS